MMYWWESKMLVKIVDLIKYIVDLQISHYYCPCMTSPLMSALNNETLDFRNRSSNKTILPLSTSSVSNDNGGAKSSGSSGRINHSVISNESVHQLLSPQLYGSMGISVSQFMTCLLQSQTLYPFYSIDRCWLQCFSLKAGTFLAAFGGVTGGSTSLCLRPMIFNCFACFKES